MSLSIGIDIGGTNTKVGIVDQHGEVIRYEVFKTMADAPYEHFLERVTNTVSSVKNTDQVVGVGVCAPNYSTKSGHIENAPNLSWGNVPLLSDLEKRLEQHVVISNDANAAAVGEKTWGAAKDLTDFIVVTIGTGIGTGIFVNNSLYSGHFGLSGEGGHIPVVIKDGRLCGCGGTGHLESYCSVTGIKETFLEMHGEEISFKELCARFNEKEGKSNKVVKKTAKYFAMGLASMINFLNPQKVILAGGGIYLGPRYLKYVQKKLQSYRFASLPETIIEYSKISGGHGAISSAAALVFLE